MADALYKLTVHGQHYGQHWEMGHYFHGTNLTLEETFENARNLCESYDNGCISPLLELLPTTCKVDRLSAQSIVPTGGVQFNFDYQPGDREGFVAGSAAANQVCPLVRLIPPMALHTAGRFFLPCIPESMINANTVSAGWTAALASYMETIMSNFGTDVIIWLSAVYSKRDGVYLNTASYDISSTIGWQMRRAKPH